MLLGQHGYLGSFYNHSHVIVTMGDSINRGNSDAVGTTPATGTVFQWDAGNSNLRMITNLDLLEPVAAGAIGSQWPQAGITYYELTRHKPVFVNTGIGGSAFFNSTPGFSWYTNDTLFDNAVTKANNCLAYLGRSIPDMVIIGLGYNDTVQGETLDQVYITSLIDRILAEWPGVRICMTQPWSSTVNTYANLTRLYQIRKWIRACAWTYPTVEIAGDLSLNTGFGANFQADNIHLNFLGNAFYGDKTMHGICQSLGYSKWTRYYTGLQYSRISRTRMQIHSDFINAIGSDFQNFDALHLPTTQGFVDGSNQFKNAMCDSAALAVHGLSSSSTFSWDGFTAAGLADIDRISSTPPSLLADKINLATDAWFFEYIGSNAVGATTASTLTGVRESASGSIWRFRQTGSNTIGITGGSTTESTNGTDTRPTANNLWGVGRDGGDQVGTKNSSEFVRATFAAVAASPGANIRSRTTGNYNNNGTIQERWAGRVMVRGAARFSIDKANFVTAINNLISAGWFTAIT